jgi:hypothetical protein
MYFVASRCYRVGYVEEINKELSFMRKLIIHYHLFKNAGTSIDNILKDSFGDKWQNWDRPSDKEGPLLPAELARFIKENPQLIAISSHDAVPPVPIGEFQVFPIVFMRHPIDRARSAYLFEWQKELGLDRPKGSFAEYIDEKLAPEGDSVIANFQVSRLSNLVYHNDVSRKSLRDYERLERAKLFLCGIPYFGLVENFHQSLIRLYYYLRPNFPDVMVVNHQANVIQDINAKLEEKLKSIQDELGDEKYQVLLQRNELDMKLYQFAVKSFYTVVKTPPDKQVRHQ